MKDLTVANSADCASPVTPMQSPPSRSLAQVEPETLIGNYPATSDRRVIVACPLDSKVA
jgi:hypothetical protein